MDRICAAPDSGVEVTPTDPNDPDVPAFIVDWLAVTADPKVPAVAALPAVPHQLPTEPTVPKEPTQLNRMSWPVGIIVFTDIPPPVAPPAMVVGPTGAPAPQHGSPPQAIVAAHCVEALDALPLHAHMS